MAIETYSDRISEDEVREFEDEMERSQQYDRQFNALAPAEKLAVKMVCQEALRHLEELLEQWRTGTYTDETSVLLLTHSILLNADVQLDDAGLPFNYWKFPVFGLRAPEPTD